VKLKPTNYNDKVHDTPTIWLDALNFFNELS
jgi:hypothetical protein